MEGKKVVLITGASSGIGKSAAEIFSKKGWKVYAGFRKTRAKIPGCEMVYLDVCESSSIKKAISLVGKKEGRLDALVNNAGYGLFGAIEDIGQKEFREQFETNVFGLVETTREALPLIRASRGRIVNVSSVVGKISFPFTGAYSSSKFAVEAISDALRLEMRPFGVKVSVIEPGPIKTNFSRNALMTSDKIMTNKTSPYAEYYRRRAELNKTSAENGLSPDSVGKAIFEACHSKNPKPRYLVAGPVGLAVFLKWALPDKLFDSIIAKMFRM